MKIQCDVCNRAEASLFCAADEAALCTPCDERVHRANKLAGKHHRFSLLQSSSLKEAPRCDVCQERRALLFCQEDRAILCRECDIPIHTANQHTRKHNRFLLTGAKLSSSSSLCPQQVTATEVRKAVAMTPEKNFSAEATVSGDGGSTSSISDYLIKTLPGWHVEEFLDSYYAPHGMCKMDDRIPFVEPELVIGPVPENFQEGVRQVPQFGYNNGPKEAGNARLRQWGKDVMAVPHNSMLGKWAV